MTSCCVIWPGITCRIAVVANCPALPCPALPCPALPCPALLQPNCPVVNLSTPNPYPTPLLQVLLPLPLPYGVLCTDHVQRPDNVHGDKSANCGCQAGATMVPELGFWHSAADSGYMAQCPNSQACLGDRNQLLACQLAAYAAPSITGQTQV